MFPLFLGLPMGCDFNMSSLVRSLLSFSLHRSMIIVSVLRRDLGFPVVRDNCTSVVSFFYRIVQDHPQFPLSPKFASEDEHFIPLHIQVLLQLCYIICLFLKGAI